MIKNLAVITIALLFIVSCSESSDNIQNPDGQSENINSADFIITTNINQSENIDVNDNIEYFLRFGGLIISLGGATLAVNNSIDANILIEMLNLGERILAYVAIDNHKCCNLSSNLAYNFANFFKFLH